MVKEQIKIWDHKKIEKMIQKINKIEFFIKKNPSSSINIITDFILEHTLETNN